MRHDDGWAVPSLTSPLLGIPFGRLAPVSEQDYLDAVESARGSDD